MANISAEIVDGILYLRHSDSDNTNNGDGPDIELIPPHAEHPIIDTDRYFTIDPYSKAVTYESDAKLHLAQFDHNSERFTFGIPRYVEGHDMSLCNTVRVHYTNVGSKGSNSDVYDVMDLQVDPEDSEFVICSWLISRNATMFSGMLNFVVQYACTKDDVVEYSWNTALFSNVKILDSMNNAELIAEEYSDVLQQWFTRLEEAGISLDPTNAVKAVENAQAVALNAIQQAVDYLDPTNAIKAVEEHIDVAMERCYGTITLIGADWGDYNSGYNYVVEIPELTNYKSIFFEPIGFDSQNLMSIYRVYIKSVEAGRVEFGYVGEFPGTGADIHLSYFIVGVKDADGEGSVFATICNTDRRAVSYIVDVPSSDDERWVFDQDQDSYRIDLDVAGISKYDDPVADVVLSNDATTNVFSIQSWRRVTHITTDTNKITVWCDTERPPNNFTIQLKVV